MSVRGQPNTELDFNELSSPSKHVKVRIPKDKVNFVSDAHMSDL